MDELDRLFRKIYEDNVSGKLNDERFYKLSDGYEAEQGQLKREIEALTAEVSQADMEVTNVAKLIAVTKKYTRIDELTPEILNAFVDKIVIHEREKKDGKRTQQIDIYYSYVGIVDILDLCQYFEHKKLKGYADFFNSSSSFCCGVI